MELLLLSPELRRVDVSLEGISDIQTFLGFTFVGKKGLAKFTGEIESLDGRQECGKETCVTLKLWAFDAKSRFNPAGAAGTNFDTAKPPGSWQVWSIREQSRSEVFRAASKFSFTADLGMHFNGDEENYFKTGKTRQLIPEGDKILILFVQTEKPGSSTINAYHEWRITNVDDSFLYLAFFIGMQALGVATAIAAVVLVAGRLRKRLFRVK